MTKEQALQYAKYAAKKALDELEKQRSVHFELTDDIPSVFERIDLQYKCNTKKE